MVIAFQLDYAIVRLVRRREGHMTGKSETKDHDIRDRMSARWGLGEHGMVHVLPIRRWGSDPNSTTKKDDMTHCRLLTGKRASSVSSFTHDLQATY